MANNSFQNKYGNIFPSDTNDIIEREKVYIVIKSGKRLVCAYDEISGLYAFPDEDTVELTEKPTVEFSVFSPMIDDGNFVREKQIYRVYEVKDAAIDNTPLVWCSVDDLLIGKIPLDATQKTGFKNLLVRVR